MARKIGELFYELRTNTELLSRDLKEGERQFEKFTAFVKANPVAALSGLATAFAGVAFAAAQAAEKIQVEMRQVSALLNLTTDQAKALGNDLEQLSRKTGESRAELASLFRAIAEGGPNGAQNVRAIADAALALSQVLGGSAQENAGGLDAITDIFNIDPARAREVAAVMFEIAKGRVPIGDVVEVLSKIAPEAQKAGIGFEEAAAAITTLLDRGYNVRNAAAAIKQLADSGAEGREALQELAGAGVDVDSALAELQRRQDEYQNSSTALAQRIRNELHDAWLDLGDRAIPLVTGSLQALLAVMNSIARPMAFLRGYLESTGDVAVRVANGLRVATEAAKGLQSVGGGFNGTGGGSTWGSPAPLSRPQTNIIDPEAIKRAEEAAKKAADAMARLRSEADRIGERFEDRNTFERAADAIDDLADKARKGGLFTAEFARRIADLRVQLAEWIRKEQEAEAAKFLESLGDREERIRELSAAMREQSALRDAEQTSHAQSIASILAETDALGKGREALDLVLQQRRRQQILDEEMQKQRAVAARESRQFGEYDRASAQQRATDRANALDGLDAANRELRRLEATAVDQVSSALAQVAQYATQIATSLGDAGENLARMAAIAGPLFSGIGALGEGLVKRDRDGNLLNGKVETGSIFDALGGAFGADSQAKALAGSLQILGAVAGIADALDVFGNRAREQAKAMEAAARAFGNALQDFVAQADPSSGAAEGIRQLRRNAETLLDQAVAALTAAFGSADLRINGQPIGQIDGEITAESLRERAVLINSVATGTSRADRELRAFTQRLSETADELEKAEAIERRRVLQATQDLAVRRLAAAGLTEEAEALRLSIAQRDELAEAERDATEEGQAYVEALKAIQAAERAAAEATAFRASVLRELDATLAILGGSPVEQLQTSMQALVQLFPQLAGLFDGLDLTTGDGLSAAAERLRELFRTLLADGISDAEQPIVDAIRRLLGGIEAAVNALVDPLQQKLDIFAIRVEVFGLSFAEQLESLLAIFASQFGTLSGFGGDLLGVGKIGGSQESLERFAQGLRDRIAAILDDGIITDEEAPLLAAYQQLLSVVLGAIGELIDEAEAEADRIENERRERLTGAQSGVEEEIDIFGIEGADAVRRRFGATAQFSPALAGILPLLGDTSAAGIARTRDALRELFRQIQDGTLPIEMFGDLTEEEIIDAILALNGDLDGLADALTNAAKAAEAAAEAERKATDSLNLRLLRASDSDTRLAQFDEQARIEREEAIAAGRSQAFLDFLDTVIEAERSKLLNDIAADAGQATGTARRATQRSVVQTIGSITTVDANNILGVLRQIESNTRILASGGLPSAPRIGVLSTSGPINVTMQIGAPVVQVNGVISPAQATEIGANIGRSQLAAISKGLGAITREDVRFLGSAKV